MKSVLKIEYLIFVVSLLFVSLPFSGICAEKVSFSRIVSLSPPLTEQIFLLGAQDRLIACTTYCLRPPQAQNKEKIGSVIDVNIEKIVSLAPDMVLATSLTKPGIVDKLREFHLNVTVFSSPKNIEEMFDQFIKLSEILDEKNKALKMVSESKAKLDLLKKILANEVHERPKVVFQIGANPLFFAGDDYFIGEFISCAGGTNILTGKKSGIYSREFIIAENPDIIMITEMGLSGKGEIDEWSKFNTMNAAKNKKIFVIDQTSICSPNPVEIPELICCLASYFHPTLKEKLNKCISETATENQ